MNPVTSCAVQHCKGFQKFTSLFVCDALAVKKIDYKHEEPTFSGADFCLLG